MMKKSCFLMFLIFPILITISACQPRPIITKSQDIVGVWVGESQWLCGNGDPIWLTTIEFKSNGSFTATMNIPMSNPPTPQQSVGDGMWSLSENNIEIKFPTTVWTGTISDNKMKGGLQDDGTSCQGNWSLTKQ